jgi:cell fate (sporulation/competence/biofilm development) regulator YlbF (YheA/YmcA/DUF963 family)
MGSSLTLIDPTISIDSFQAAQQLGNVLSDTPEFKAFFAASKAMHNDPIVQQLETEMHAHQTALHWGCDTDGQHAAELTRLELELEDIPVMKQYREKEREVSALFQAVDKIISQEAGVDFAINAQRGGCACGG